MNDNHLRIQQSPENAEFSNGSIVQNTMQPNAYKNVEDIDIIQNSALDAANYIRLKCNLTGPINYGIICGSGLHEIAGIISDKIIIPFGEIPGMPSSLVQGHHNFVNIGAIGTHNVICFQGRCHYYEGHPMWKVSLPMRIMKCLAVPNVFVTNSSGGINSTYKVGDIMLIKDHISIPCIAGNNPLRGENDTRYGPRFPDVSNAYDAKLRKKCKKIAKESGLNDVFHEGIYCMSAGPSYETKAEIRMFRMLGGDVIGMSTAPEVITASHAGLKILGLTLIANMLNCDKYEGDDEEESTINGSHKNSNEITSLSAVNHEDVLLAATQMGKRISLIIQKMITDNA